MQKNGTGVVSIAHHLNFFPDFEIIFFSAIPIYQQTCVVPQILFALQYYVIYISILYQEWLNSISRELTTPNVVWSDMENVPTVTIRLPAFLCSLDIVCLVL